MVLGTAPVAESSSSGAEQWPATFCLSFRYSHRYSGSQTLDVLKVNTEITHNSVVQEPRVCSGKRDMLVESATLNSSLLSVGGRCGWTFSTSFAVE